MFFGETELRKWIVLATLARTAEDKPSELIRHSLVRARFCESVARLAHKGLEQSAFLTGLFSLLDALIDRPLEETLSSNVPGAGDRGGAQRASTPKAIRWRAFINWRGPTKWPIGSAWKRSRYSLGFPWPVWARCTARQPAGRNRFWNRSGCPASLNRMR